MGVVEVMANGVEFTIPSHLWLTEYEREELIKFSKEKDGKKATRALIILWYDSGKTEDEIADLLFISARTVRRWIKRYKEEKIEGLLDKERTGRPRKANEDVEKFLENLMEKNPEDFGYKAGFWITGLLCVHLFTILGIMFSNSTVRRVLHRLDYVVRRPKLWSGPCGPKPPEIEIALGEVKKTKQSCFTRTKQPSTSYL